MFSTTTTIPTQLVQPPPRNNRKWSKPHGYEHDRSKPAKLNRDGEDLIVGIYAGDRSRA